MTCFSKGRRTGRRRRWSFAIGLLVALTAGQPFPAAGAEEAAAGNGSRHHEADSLPTTHRQPEAAEDAPRSLEIDAGGISLRFGGFAKADFIQDFDFVGNQDQFKVNTIAVSGDPDAARGGATNVSARQTRLTLEVVESEAGQRMRAYVEGDFFGSGNSFRLRHGYGEWKGLLAGQTWSTFQDISARPFTIDYEGPDSEIFVRQPMLRYTAARGDGIEWAVAVEDPDGQVTTSAIAGAGRSELPDLAAHWRMSRRWGHVQVGALLRQLRFVSDDGAVDETTSGYGLNLSGTYRIGDSDMLLGHISVGSGMGRYIESFGGTASDAVVTSDGSLDALDARAWTIGYTHHWNAALRSTASYGVAEIDNLAPQGAAAIHAARSLHVNIVYDVTRQVLIGGELMWGERENNDGADGDATRLQVSVQYKFR